MPGVEERLLVLSAAVTLVLLAAGTAATPRKSSQDQYEQQPPRPARAASDKQGQARRILGPNANVNANVGQHRFSVSQPLPLPLFTSPNVPELQVGCADGSVHIRPYAKHIKHEETPIEVLKNSLMIRHKRNSEGRRDRRDYIRWYAQTTQSQSQSQPQPQPRPQQVPAVQTWQTYQLASPLPYWIPIWGNPKRIPVFFPAKPILFNPGYPVRNKPTPPKGPETPSTESPLTDSSEGMGGITIGGRINIPDDRPIWGIVEADPPAAPAPTRPPATAQRPRKPPTPPLLHRPSITDELASPGQSMQPIQPFRPQTPVTSRPVATTTTTARPPPPPQAQTGLSQPTNGPNRCVWAIISCCSPLSTNIRYNCFEQLGCPGAFWDTSPCSREITLAALDAAQKFYDQS